MNTNNNPENIDACISQSLPNFYPRPVLAFGHCRCLHMPVRVCIRISTLGCPRHNLSPVPTRTTKIGPEVQTTLVRLPIVWGSLIVDFKVKFNFKIKMCPILCMSYYRLKVELSTFRHKMQNTLVEIPIVWGFIDRQGQILLEIHNFTLAAFLPRPTTSLSPYVGTTEVVPNIARASPTLHWRCQVWNVPLSSGIQHLRRTLKLCSVSNARSLGGSHLRMRHGPVPPGSCRTCSGGPSRPDAAQSLGTDVCCACLTFCLPSYSCT